MRDFVSKNKIWFLMVTAIVCICSWLAVVVEKEAHAAAGDSLLKTRYGITATVDELNKMDGVSATATELSYVSGVTSAIQTQLDAKTTSTLADTKIFVGNSGGVATAVSMSGDATIANSGAVSLAANSVDSAEIAANAVGASEIADSAITATQMALNSVTATDAFTNTVTVSITSGNTGADVAVEAGSILLRVEKVSGFNNDVTITKSVYPDASNQWIVNTDAHAGTLVINGIFWRP